MSHSREINKYMEELAAMSDYDIQVAQSALTIAGYEYPNLDESKCMRIFEEMGHKLGSRLAGVTEAHAVVAEIKRLLCDEEGFRGNTADYYDPRNCLLNDVLERKQGIPVTLSIVYIEVGRRADLPLFGVALPGHFVTGYLSNDGPILMDPFNGGAILTERLRPADKKSGGLGRSEAGPMSVGHHAADMRDDADGPAEPEASSVMEACLDGESPGPDGKSGLVSAEEHGRVTIPLHGSSPHVVSFRALAPAWPKQILVRLLRNLKASYWRQGSMIKALQIIEWVTVLAPDSPAEYKERGFINQELGDSRKAADDYERYLQLAPDAEDRDSIRDAIVRLKADKVLVH